MRDSRIELGLDDEISMRERIGMSSAWLVSLIIHAIFMVVIGLTTTGVTARLPAIMLLADLPDTQTVELVEPPEFHADAVVHDAIGASSLGGVWDQAGAADLVVDVPSPPATNLPQFEVGEIEWRQVTEAMSGIDPTKSLSIKGAAGVAVTGAEGAVDRITEEILQSLDERPTLVVWFFDRSGSLVNQREVIRQRFHRVYEELGVAENKGRVIFQGADEAPLLSAVVGFGQEIDFLTKPTPDVGDLERAVAEIELDRTGEERVFSALQAAVKRFRSFRTAKKRNVMFVVFTDEAGNDQDQLDTTVDILKKLAIPVYVVGVPAPFGQKEAWVKWVDPDPTYDQTPVSTPVDQGPETLWPELVRVSFTRRSSDDAALDSGFGPFSLTRLCVATNGMYFTVHPNRPAEGRAAKPSQTAVYSAYFQRFFDPAIMRRYRPDYVSAREYQRQVESSKLRSALVRAAQMSAFDTGDPPRQRFVFRGDAEFVQALTEAQKVAARVEPFIGQVYETLRAGEAARDKEIRPRWQAGFDLAMGRVLAVKVRAETYNLMLAQAKQGMKFQDPSNNTWKLVADNGVTVGSRWERDAETAKKYLQRVQQEHPDTPWAWLAAEELRQPLSWKWQEEFTPIAPPAPMVAQVNNGPNLPQDDQVRQLAPPPKKRSPPKL